MIELGETIEAVADSLSDGTMLYVDERESILHFLKQLKELLQQDTEETFIDCKETERDLLESEYFHPND